MTRSCSALVSSLALTAFLLSGQSIGASEGVSREPLLVAVSILPLVGLVERIGGDLVDVRAVVSPGESPTTFQPNDREVSRLLRSEVYFCLGMPFESGPWFRAVRQQGGVDLVDLRRGVDLLPDGKIPDGSRCRYLAGKDPHFWLSTQRLKILVSTVASTLSERDPSRREVYEGNRKVLLQELELLEGELLEQLAPYSGKPFFVYHPTWGYLAADYGLEQLAVEDHGSAPSDSQMTALRRRFASSGSRFLFVQPQIAGRSATSAAKVLGAELREVDPLGRDVLASLRDFAAMLEASLQ